MDIYKYLEAQGIAYTRYDHPPVFTVEEAKRWTSHIEGMHCKNLFLKNRNGKRHFLLVLQEDRPVSLKDLAERLGISNLSFASPERLMKYMRLEPGSVSPLGLVNNTDRNVEVYFGEEVYKSDISAFHPNTNTATLTFKTKDLLRFIEELGYSIHTI